MAKNKRGKQSFVLDEPPVITAWASIAGKKEGEGPLAHAFDMTSTDTYFGQRTWEQAEKHMQQLALDTLATKANLSKRDFDLVYSGDLLNQCIGSSFSLRNTGIPHLGLYGACSTMAESLIMASMTVGGGFRKEAVAMTSSHFASSERQYRFPLGYGGQRTPTSQWTVTGSGAALIQRKDVTERDYSTVFFIDLGLAVVCFAILQITAPWISAFYAQDITKPLQIYAITVFFNATIGSCTILSICYSFTTSYHFRIFSVSDVFFCEKRVRLRTLFSFMRFRLCFSVRYFYPWVFFLHFSRHAPAPVWSCHPQSLLSRYTLQRPLRSVLRTLHPSSKPP